MTVELTERQMELMKRLFNFIHSMPCCADELLDCDMDEFNELSEIF